MPDKNLIVTYLIPCSDYRDAQLISAYLKNLEIQHNSQNGDIVCLSGIFDFSNFEKE